MTRHRPGCARRILRILRKRRERAAWRRFTQAEEELGLELHIICVKDQIARHLRGHLEGGGS